MSEAEMGLLELLSECIMNQLDFNSPKEIEQFCNELKIELISLHDPDFIYDDTESESEDDDVGEPEIIQVSTDNNGFMKII